MSEGRFSRDPFPVFSAEGHKALVGSSGLGRDVPSLMLSIQPIFQGALRDCSGGAIVACDMPEPCKFPSLDMHSHLGKKAKRKGKGIHKNNTVQRGLMLHPHSADLLDQGQHVVGEEGRFQRSHLVEDAAQCPHVRLLTVRLILHNLRAAIQ